MTNKHLTPAETLEVTLKTASSKASSSTVKLLILGFFGGAFIALAAQGSNMAAFNLLAGADTYGLGRALAGTIFATGLMLVVLAGAELFTGNTLMIGGVIRRQITIGSMLRNWVIVYVMNFVGAVFVAWLISVSGQLHGGENLLGAVSIKIAAGKAGLDFGPALVLGILCNWLVCLAIWIAYGASSTTGKIFGIFFPIWLFVTSGFEHSIANMYYVPAGILAKANGFEQAALDIGVAQSAIDNLTWGSFFVNNLIPVTIGNIIGGSVFVCMAYLAALKEKSK